MTTYTTLISVPELRALAASGAPLMVFDCSFDLAQPGAGAQHYLQAHIPGAVHADLDRTLSALHGAPGAHGTITATQADTPASGGRHPLPSREKLATWLRSVGFTNATVMCPSQTHAHCQCKTSRAPQCRLFLESSP